MNVLCPAGGAVGSSGVAVLGHHDDGQFPVHGCQQVLVVVVQRAGHVHGALEDPAVHLAEPEGDQGTRTAVGPVRAAAVRGRGQGPDGAAVRLGVHAVPGPGRAADQGTVQREYCTPKRARFTGRLPHASTGTTPESSGKRIRSTGQGSLFFLLPLPNNPFSHNP